MSEADVGLHVDSAGAFLQRGVLGTLRRKGLQPVAVCPHVDIVPFQFRLYEGRKQYSEEDPGAEEEISSQRVVICGQFALNQSENDPEYLREGIQESGRRSLGLGVGDLDGKFEAERQVAGHEEAEDAGGEEDQVDAVTVQGEGEDHHAEEGEAVDNQSGHLVSLGVVQPQATQDGAHHSGHDQRQTDPSRVQLLVLMGRGDRRRR